MNVVRAMVVAALLLLAACGGTGTPETAAGSARSTGSTWSATFVQDRPDQDTPDAHVKLVNDGPRATVTGVRLLWPGFAADGFQSADMDFATGHTHRLDIRLPAPTCEPTPTRAPKVQARLSDGDAAVVELDDDGATVLRQIWSRQCSEQRLLEAVDVRFGDQWRPADGALLGELVARRGGSAAQARLVEVRGSVLLELSTVGRERVLLPAAAEVGRLPVRVSGAGRCDAHSLSASSQTFTLRVWISLDGGPEQSLVIRPDAAAREQMQDLINSSCGTG